MNRLRRWSVLTLLGMSALMASSSAHGQATAAKENKTAEKWLLDRSLSITPQSAPVPVFKYRLFPLYSQRKEGNAVPIYERLGHVYERLGHEPADTSKRLLEEKTAQWNALPLEKIPLAEAKEFLNRWKYNLKQLELGARRKYADWNFTLDSGNPIGLLLPEFQDMRLQTRLLVLKARVEIAEGNFSEAIRTLETGFAFSQHLAEAPFFIAALVGIASANQIADCLLELVERPGAPNIYWALTAMPRPLIDLRHNIDFEHGIIELQFPDLADVDRPRPPEQWQAALDRYCKEIERLKGLGQQGKDKKPTAGTLPTEPAAKSKNLAAAKEYLAHSAGLSAASIDAMPAAQVLMLYAAYYNRELRDDWFKLAYLPYPQARRFIVEGEKRLKAIPETEGAWPAKNLFPAFIAVLNAQGRLERKLAALRVIEALRLHAAAHDRQLPNQLSQVTVAAIPEDPGTGQPFDYQRDGQTAMLTSRIPEEPLTTSGLRYRISVRK